MFENIPQWVALFGHQWHVPTAIVAFIIGLILG